MSTTNETLITVKIAADALAAAKQDYRKAVRDAYQAGASYRDIAIHAGVSHMTIQSIVRGK